ncbi:MAG: glycerophosphodiester phosphodiesterase [Bacteroidota bacterium]
MAALVGAVMLFESCSKIAGVDVPVFAGGGKLSSAAGIDAQRIQQMEGIYDVLDGTDQVGKTVVIKTSGSTLSIFTGKNAGLFVLQYGSIDSTVVFEGYWRYTQGSETGLVQFEIPADAGGKKILLGTQPDRSFIVIGAMGEGSGDLTMPVTLQYNRPLKDTSFAIIAHRGGGRNSDRLAESENSLGIIPLAETYGANGIEIDVRLTKDGIPILFHDENFSPRLVNGEYCIGPVSNYTFRHIRTLCTLKNGEPVPTLREALDVVLNKTTLSLVWLDVKSPAAIAVTSAIQAEYKQKALQMGRTVDILLGLSTDELVAEFKKQQLVSTADALCELSIDDVRQTDARVWAPRWTLGPLPAEAGLLRAEGRRTFVWTLDQREFILPFLQNESVDGILTNYPSLIAFEYYVYQ